MVDEAAFLRNYKRGSWDLRKIDRRKELTKIDFNDRRSTERRGVSQLEQFESVDALKWVPKSKLDE